jgi:hypothetical protein
MLSILKDAQLCPKGFTWFGGIDRQEIELWLESAGLSAPSDVIELWRLTGGGDLFDDSETIFRPTSISSAMHFFLAGDDVDSATAWRNEKGMPNGYLAFHNGLTLSVIRQSGPKIVTLDERFHETGEFSGVDDWYLRTLRACYAELYGLPERLP